jgi:hypothetical protein
VVDWGIGLFVERVDAGGVRLRGSGADLWCQL